MNGTKAVVIFSGGQDSTTCLAWTLKKFDTVECITFEYGQRHAIEINQSKEICAKYGVKQTIVDIKFLDTLVESALTSNGDVDAINSKGLPASFVPNRNQLFITLAHAYAQKIGAEAIVTGVCSTDANGYPDTRSQFIDKIEATSNLGSDSNIVINTPLINKLKFETFLLADELGCLEDVLELSHTCYNGNRTDRHPYGYGCDKCGACRERKKGFETFKSLKQ